MRLVRFLKFQYYKLIRLKDAPAKVAQGVGWGFAMDFAIPVPFLSIFVAFITARFLGFNSFSAVISATALKPFFPGIITLNVYVSAILVSWFPALKKLYVPHIDGTTLFERTLNGIFSKGLPYLIACQINAIIVFFVTCLIGYYLLRMRQHRLKKSRK